MRTSLLLFVLGACAEPAFEMSLSIPAMPANYDLSCVTAVDVAPHIGDEDEPLDIGLRLVEMGVRDPCVEISPQTSFEGIRAELRGKVSFELPDEGLAEIQIRGRVGGCKDRLNYHEAIFYGGATFDGSDITLPLTPNLSCNARETVKVRPIDIIAMLTDPTHACRPVADAIATFAADFRPSAMEMAPTIFEAGSSVSLLDPATGTTALGTFSGTMANDTCVAVAHQGQRVVGATCVNKGAPLLCGTSGEVEIAVAPFLIADAAINIEAYDDATSLVLGSVWETLPNKPVADAVVTAPGAVVEYVELKNGTMEVIPNGTKTGPSGLFIVYTAKPMSITITAPGHQSRTMTVAGGWELDGTALVVLPKM